LYLKLRGFFRPNYLIICILLNNYFLELFE